MDKIDLYFAVTAETKFGEEVFLCGNINQLGNWNTHLAHKLYTNESNYPEWKSPSPIEISPEVILQFKVCIQDRNKRVLYWEDIKGNRITCMKESSIVSFEINSPNLSYFPTFGEPTQKNIKELPVRKGTQDFLWGEEVSEGSSGSQQNWRQINTYKEKEDPQLTTKFIEEARKIFQYGSTNNRVIFQANKEPKQKQIKNMADYIVAPSHLFESSSHSQALNFLDHKKFIQNSNISLYEDNNTNVYHFMHFNEEIALQQHFMRHHLYIFYLQERSKPEIVEKLMSLNDHIYLCASQQEKISSVIDYCYKNSIKTKIISSHIIKLQTGQSVAYLIYNPTNFSKLLSTDVAKLKLNINFYHQHHSFFPPIMRINQLLQSDSFKQIKNKKLCIVLRCSLLKEISQKILNNFINISSKKNIEVYLLTSDDNLQIQEGVPISQNENQKKRRVPIAQKEKFLIITTYGDIISSQGKKSNFLSILELPSEKYQGIYEDIVNKICVWKSQVKIENFKFTVDIRVPETGMGKLICEFLEGQVMKSNENSRFKVVVEQKTVNQEIIITLKPLILSDVFFSKLMVAVNQSDYSDYILFDFVSQQPYFTQLNEYLQSVCMEKGIKYEGFHVREEGSGGINEKMVDRILLKIAQALQKSSIISSESRKLKTDE